MFAQWWSSGGILALKISPPNPDAAEVKVAKLTLAFAVESCDAF